MDVFEAIEARRSCRNFLPDAVDEADIQKLLAAGMRAPSPLNTQPWQFVVVTASAVRQQIAAEAERCRRWAIEASGWQWLGKYSVAFLKQVPVMIAVAGDPGKSGVDGFQEGGPVAYQHACAAAAQNILLAAHALGLGGLWFTLFDKPTLAGILKIEAPRIPLALLCIGKPADTGSATPRKDVAARTTLIR